MSTDAVTFILRASGWPAGVDPEHQAFAEERAVAAALEGHAVIDGQVVKVEPQMWEWDEYGRPRLSRSGFDLPDDPTECPLFRIVDRAAVVTDVSPIDGSELVAIGGHDIQYGGRDGDGYCYAHQSFDCIDNLTDAEQTAVANAKHPVRIVDGES